MLALMILGLVLLGIVIFVLLDRHEKRRLAAGSPRHSGLRLAFGTFALLTMLFAGGCSLLFAINMDGTYVTLPAIMVLGGPPFAVGLFVWWLSMRRKPANPPPS
jgi:hypothetical protein